jgi:hypothetical protein
MKATIDGIEVMLEPSPEAIAGAYFPLPEGESRDDWRVGGLTESGDEAPECSWAEFVDGIRDQRCWGFADEFRRTIRVWVGDAATTEEVLHLLGHEFGHLDDDPLVAELEDEEWAETCGRSAASAYRAARALLGDDWMRSHGGGR